MPINQDFDFQALQEEMEMLERGKKLARLVRDPEWDTIPAILEDYRDKAGFSLRSLPPGDPAVITAHAAWSAISDLCQKFNKDIQRFITMTPSEELKAYLISKRDNLDPMRVMERN